MSSDCGTNVHHKCQTKVANLCDINQKLLAEAFTQVSQKSTKRPDANTQEVGLYQDYNKSPGTDTTDATPFGRLWEGSSPRSPSRISHQTHITAEHFTFHKVLGKGSFSKVFSG
ncbi:protein kinase C delta type-like [Brachyhypopomus gauderio]|uniref:protein kinase C delta type-like n=1 Tax=Brachyhypopomus gauderio TaxID=698409 RepID=UPI004041E5B3